MGRKHREERREKREDFVAKRTQQKRKNTLLAVGILGIIGLIVGYASFTFVTMGADTPGAPPGAGKYGNTIHRHASGVTLDYLFETLGIEIDEDCYIFADGRQFCTNEDYSLKYFINRNFVDSINDHVIQDGDRILISYGSETEDDLGEQLNELYSQIIRD